MMKKIERLYFILTYTFFIYPPFIWGLVEIYRDFGDNIHLVVLLINVFLLIVIALICFLLIKNRKLHPPKKEERKYLLFGFAGNVVMFFYTFQNIMNIDNIVTIYLVLLVVMLVHYLLISRKFRPLELWIILPIFIVYDYLYLAITGCGWGSDWYCYPNQSGMGLLNTLYWLIIIFVTLYYVYKLVLYRLLDIFKVFNVLIVLYVSYQFSDLYNSDDRIMLTCMILLPFFVIIDFIVKIVNKTYTHKMLLFYIRTTTLLFVFMVLGTGEVYGQDIEIFMLAIFVGFTYVSLGVSILKTLLGIEVKEENPLSVYRNLRSGPRFQEVSKKTHDVIKEQYGDMLASHVKLDENSYSVAIVLDDLVIGFISTYMKNLSAPLEGDKEAYINVIEIHPDHRNKGYATKLIQMTEAHFRSEGIKQIRAWSSEDKYEAINLWKKLHYGLSPASIISEKTEEIVKGYYVVKKI